MRKMLVITLFVSLMLFAASAQAQTYQQIQPWQQFNPLVLRLGNTNITLMLYGVPSSNFTTSLKITNPYVTSGLKFRAQQNSDEPWVIMNVITFTF